MMAAAAAICGECGTECYVSMEERMGCVSAPARDVCRTLLTKTARKRESYKRVCVDALFSMRRRLNGTIDRHDRGYSGCCAAHR